MINGTLEITSRVITAKSSRESYNSAIEFDVFTACLFRSVKICWLLSNPLSSKNTTEIVSSPSDSSFDNASRIAAFLCCPSLIKKTASMETSKTPISAFSFVEINLKSPSIDAARAENT